MPQEKEWWEDVIKEIELLFQVCPGVRGESAREHDLKLFIGGVVSEANTRRDAQWREKLEGMIRVPQNRKESYSLKLKARNEAFNEAKDLFI